MPETRKFPTVVVASITTCIMLTDEFSQVHECLEYVLGRPIWTHEIPGTRKEAMAAIMTALPDMPTECAEDWRVTRDAVVERFGETVTVPKGNTERTLDPATTLKMLRPDADVAVVVTGGKE